MNDLRVAEKSEFSALKHFETFVGLYPTSFRYRPKRPAGLWLISAIAVHKVKAL